MGIKGVCSRLEEEEDGGGGGGGGCDAVVAVAAADDDVDVDDEENDDEEEASIMIGEEGLKFSEKSGAELFSRTLAPGLNNPLSAPRQ